MDLAAVLDVPQLAGTRWSVEVLDADGRVLAGREGTELQPTASLAWRGRTAAYAALCTWDGDVPDSEILITPILRAMRALGAMIRRELAG